MRVVATPIPTGSHGVRVWTDLEPGDELPADKRPYVFACNFLHVDSETCELAQAAGKVSRGLMIAVGHTALQLGYKRMVFRRRVGRAATPWARLLRSEGSLNYFEVDLIATAADLARREGKDGKH